MKSRILVSKLRGWRGAFSGVFDASLQRLVLDSPMSIAWVLRIAGLGAITASPMIAIAPALAVAFRRAVAAEYLLICMVLSITAIMTTFFSPEC